MSSDLPAPYRNPWQTLGESLQAVVADGRLRLQQLWRRNRQGSLWRPSWWPGPLAALFWPLLLGLVAAVVVAVVAFAALPQRRSQTPPPAVTASAPAATEASAPPAETPATPSTGSPNTPPTTSLHNPLEDAPEPAPAGSAEGSPLTAAEPLPAPQQSPAPAPLDPLAALLQRPEADGLLRSARALPDQLSLELVVAPAFAALPRAEQERRAGQWQQWAHELGYDHLELRDSRSGLLARDALIGNGMIVLSDASRP